MGEPARAVADCVFCEILSGRLPSSLLYRDDVCAAFLDVQPVNPGHLLADGEAAMQAVFHVHLHVLPRYAGDGFGFRFPPAYDQKPARADLDTVADKIRQAL